VPLGKDYAKLERNVKGREGIVSFRTLTHWLAAGVLLVGGCIATSAPVAWGQEESSRKVKTKVAPTYPELARRLNISGVVKVEVMVAPNGSVKNTKLVGGHPLLAAAALEALKKWRYEAGPQETTGIVEFHFDPNQ
jgi:TonB family protein